MGTQNKNSGLAKWHKIVSVDIDGYIAEKMPSKRGEFIRENFDEFIPIPSMIERVNNLFRKRYVIIYHTARHPRHYEQTFAWLLRQGCYFHALRMGKLRADYYLDDKNVDVDEL